MDVPTDHDEEMADPSGSEGYVTPDGDFEQQTSRSHESTPRPSRTATPLFIPSSGDDHSGEEGPRMDQTGMHYKPVGHQLPFTAASLQSISSREPSASEGGQAQTVITRPHQMKRFGPDSRRVMKRPREFQSTDYRKYRSETFQQGDMIVEQANALLAWQTRVTQVEATQANNLKTFQQIRAQDHEKFHEQRRVEQEKQAVRVVARISAIADK